MSQTPWGENPGSATGPASGASSTPYRRPAWRVVVAVVLFVLAGVWGIGQVSAVTNPVLRDQSAAALAVGIQVVTGIVVVGILVTIGIVVLRRR